MRSVLLALSDDDSRRRLVSSLGDLDQELRVYEARNGEEAIQALTAHPIHLLVTELDMPVMDGFELLAFVVRHQPSLDVVVIGEADSGRSSQALVSGQFKYLKKPVTSTDFAEVVRAALSRPAEGPVTGLSLAGFLQLLNSERRSCSLSVRAKGRSGRVHVVEGEVVHAVHESQTGRRALYEMLTWHDPALEAGELESSPERTVEDPLPRLLLEGAFWLDQGLEASALTRSEVPEATAPEADAVGAVSRSWQEPARMERVQRALRALLGVDGAIGAAIVDLESSDCLAHVTRDFNPDFPKIAARSGWIAKRRLAAMSAPGTTPQVRQLKLYNPDHVALIRFASSDPHLLLYFTGDTESTDMAQATKLLSELDRHLSG